VRGPGGFTAVWRGSELFADLRRPQTGGACTSCSAYGSCRGGCMAAKFFTGLPLDGPDPECVHGWGEPALAAVPAGAAPRPTGDHSHRPARVPAAVAAPGPEPTQGSRSGSRSMPVPAAVAAPGPEPTQGSRSGSRPVPVVLGRRPPSGPAVAACEPDPLAGFRADLQVTG